MMEKNPNLFSSNQLLWLFCVHKLFVHTSKDEIIVVFFIKTKIQKKFSPYGKFNLHSGYTKSKNLCEDGNF